MTNIIETCEILCLDGIMIGDEENLKSLMLRQEYLNFEYYQTDSPSNRLFVCETIDNMSLMIFTMAN